VAQAPAFTEINISRTAKRRLERMQARSCERREIPAHWLRIAALVVNCGLWALIIWGVRALLRL
jgi:hypothetical protein